MASYAFSCPTMYAATAVATGGPRAVPNYNHQPRRYYDGNKRRNPHPHHKVWMNRYPPAPVAPPPPPTPIVEPVVATAVPPVHEMMMSMFTMMEERRLQEQRQMEERRFEEQKEQKWREEKRHEEFMKMEERRLEEQRQMEEKRLEEQRQMEEKRLEEQRQMEERRLAQERELKEKELAIREKKNAILQERVDFQKRVYQECKYGHRAYHQEKNRLMESVNNRPCLMMSTDTVQDGELKIYGTKADPWFKTDDVREYVDRLTQKTDSETVELEPIREAIHDYISTVSFPAVVVKNLYDGEEGDKKDDYMSISAWEDCSVVMERTTRCSSNLVARYLVYLNQHLPYSSFHGMKAYEFPQKRRLFSGTPSLFTKREVEGEEKVEEYEALAEMVDPDQEESESEVEEEKEKTDHKDKKEIGFYDDSVLSKAMIGRCLESLRSRLEEFKTKTGMSIRIRNALLGFIALNRARLEVIRLRLEKNGVYNPDATERYLQDQKFKTENPDLRPMYRKAFLDKRWDQKLLNHCDICGVYIAIEKEREKGHVVPAFRQNSIPTVGTDGIHNLILTCKKCNEEAGSLDPYLCRTYNVVDRIEKIVKEHETEEEKKKGWNKISRREEKKQRK